MSLLLTRINIMHISTPRDKAYGRLSKLAQLKVDLDAANTIEDKFRVAITHRHLPLIQHFLQNGLTPETSLSRDWPALKLAINYCGRSLDTMHLFFKNGFFVHYKDEENNNLLHWIVAEMEDHMCFSPYLERNIELFKIFLVSGCDLEQVNSKGKTPLQRLDDKGYFASEKRQILLKLHEVIDEVRAGQFQYINPLPEITPISPEQLDLSPQEKKYVALFQSQEYEKIESANAGFLLDSTTSSERYVHAFFPTLSPDARQNVKKEFDALQECFKLMLDDSKENEAQSSAAPSI